MQAPLAGLAFALLLGCAVPSDSPPPDALADATTAATAPALPPDPPLCVSQVWSGDARDNRSGGSTLSSKLSDMEALGARAVRHATGGGAYTRGPRSTDRAVADSLRAHGFLAILQVNGDTRTEAALTPDEVERAGAAWGPFLAEYADVYPYGVQVGNEVNLRLRNVYNRAGGGAAGETAARTEAEHAVDIVTAFARGVKSTCPACRVSTGGLGGVELRMPPGADAAAPNMRSAALYLTLLAPFVRSGLLENALDAHIYRAGRWFRRDQGRLRWNENYVGTIAALLRQAGWPAGTALRATEANVVLTDFASDEAAAEALSTFLSTLYRVPRMDLVCVFSPWEAGRRYGVRPGTAVGRAYAESAPQ